MRVFKIILSILLGLAAAALLCVIAMVLLDTVPGKKAEPTVLQTDAIFSEETESVPENSRQPAKSEEKPQESVPPQTEEAPQPEEMPEESPAPEEEQDTLPQETDTVTQWMQTMTLEEMVWQLVITTPESITGVGVATRAGETTRQALAACPVGGLCYFAANLQDREQTKTMLSLVQSYAKTPMFLAVDEEGGLVSRVGSNEAMGTTHFAAAEEYGSRADAAEVCAVGQSMADQLLALGFNLNFAPVADVITNPNNTEIGSRAYSSDPQVAAAMVKAMVQGLQSHNMMACLKHFPGHGSTQVDSHQDKTVSMRTLEELQQTEWVPFRSGIEAGVSFVMLSHLTNENLSTLPSSMSSEVVACLRQELGFDGIVITDSLQMGAIANYYSSAEAAVQALQAGADMLLMPMDPKSAVQGVLDAVAAGTLPQARIEESVRRILTAKSAFGLLPKAE